MAITVTKNLPEVGLAGNPMVLELTTDNQYSAAGSKAGLELTFSGIDTTAGHSITFSWNTLSITFTLAAAPDDSGEQLPAATVGEAQDDWMARVAAALQLNYYILRDFEVESDVATNKITLTAREKGSDYTVTVSDNTITNVAFSATAGTDRTLRENYELVARVYNEATGELLTEDRIAPDSDGAAEFDFHDVLAQELETGFLWPEESATLYEQKQDMIKAYLVKYAESYGDTVRKITAYAEDAYAAAGGFDYKMLAALNGVEYSYLDYIITFKSFLTWQPATKTINKTQPEKLYFLIFDTFSSISLMVKVYYEDGTNSGNQTAFTINPADKYTIWELLTGYALLDVEQYSSKTPTKYKVWIKDKNGNIRSRVQTYVIDPRYYRNERTFLFRNSLGGYDTLRATGRRTSRNEYERMYSRRNDEEYAIEQVYKALETSSFTQNTGWITQSERDWLRELLISREVYVIIGDYKFPVIIENSRQELYDDNEDLYDLEIKYRYNFFNPVYSGSYEQQPLLAEDYEILLNEDGEWLFA